jgi:hypothetical protein
MVARLAVIVTSAIAAAVLVLPAAGSVFAGHTKRQAEVNVLHATGVLRRWHVPVLNLRANTVKSNTRVSCVGATRPIARRFRAFVCTIAYRRVRVRLKYTAFHGNGFGMKNLPPRRAAG